MKNSSFYNKFVFLFVALFFTIILFSCKERSERKYFNGDVVFFKDTLQFETLVGEQVILDGLYTGKMEVCDSLIFMQHFIYPDYFIAVFNHYSGEHLGNFISKGRGPNEYIDLSWIYQFFYEEGYLKALLYSFSEKKVVIWNITESLNKGITSAIQIDFEENDSKKTLGGFMFFSNNGYLIASTKDLYSPNLPNQTFHKIEYNTQETKQNYSFYNKHIDNNDNVFKDLYYHMPLAHNTKGTKLASAMAILHQINILDIETGELKGFRMNGTANFHKITNLHEEMKFHYLSITADSNNIYALYVGEITNLKSGFPNGNIIHVFDWNGKFVRKLSLDKEAGHISIDSQNQALLIKNDYTDEIYKYFLNK